MAVLLEHGANVNAVVRACVLGLFGLAISLKFMSGHFYKIDGEIVAR